MQAGLVREEKRGKWSFYSLDVEPTRGLLATLVGTWGSVRGRSRAFRGSTMAHPSVGPKRGAEMVPSIDRLCAEFGGPLKRFIARRVWNGHDAEDLLQEVFLKAHVAIHDLRDTERVRPWLYRSLPTRLPTTTERGNSPICP
jgi:hypothetical protein